MDETFNIDINKPGSSNHILILGSSGSGKSFLMRSIWNRAFKSGAAVAIPVDMKPEAFTSSRPLQKKFHKFLLPIERNLIEHSPLRFPMKNYRPFFLTKATDSENIKGEENTQFEMTDLNEFDLDLIMGVTEMTDQKKVLISNAFSKIKNGELRSIDDMCNEIERPEYEGHPTTKKSISAVLRSIRDKGVVGSRFDKVDFVSDIKKGMVPVMNMMGAFRSGSSDHYSAAYVAIVLRQLLDAKQSGEIPKSMRLLIMLDEVNRYFAKDSDDSCAAKEILRALDMGRQYGISLCCSSQDLGRISDTLLNQSNYVFVGYDLPPDHFREIIRKKEPHKVTDHYNFGQETSHVLGSMKTYRGGSRDWLFIDATKRDDDYKIFKPLAPLSATREVGD